MGKIGEMLDIFSSQVVCRSSSKALRCFNGGEMGERVCEEDGDGR